MIQKVDHSMGKRNFETDKKQKSKKIQCRAIGIDDEDHCRVSRTKASDGDLQSEKGSQRLEKICDGALSIGPRGKARMGKLRGRIEHCTVAGIPETRGPNLDGDAILANERGRAGPVVVCRLDRLVPRGALGLVVDCATAAFPNVPPWVPPASTANLSFNWPPDYSRSVGTF